MLLYWSMDDLGLPSRIKVKIVRGGSGSYVAELPEYDIHTESESLSGLDYMINDLIYVYFDVPRKLWGKVWYKEIKTEPDVDLQKLLLYRQYVTSSEYLSK